MYEQATANGHHHLLQRIHGAIQGAPLVTDPVLTGTGNGKLEHSLFDPAAPAETWTVACTDATTPGAELWSVTGSTSGAQAAATTGVAYDNTLISFTIAAGLTDFVVTDEFVLVGTLNPLIAASEIWVIDRWDDVSTNWELIAHGPGVSGTEAIYVGITSYEDVGADYYNLAVNTFAGYAGSNTFDTQPGRDNDNHACPLWQFEIPYYLIVNGNRIILLAKIETLYQAFYVGRFLPYGTPGQYPYPVGLWSMLTTQSATRYSDAGNELGLIRNGGTSIRFVDNSYKSPRNWPFYELRAVQITRMLRDNPDSGSYPLMPVVMHEANAIYGEWDSVYHVSGFANVVENTVTIGADTFIVWRNHAATGFYDYFACKLA